MLPHIYPFGLSISMYTLLNVLGCLLGLALMLLKRRKFGIDIWDMLQAIAVALIGGAPCSKLLNAIYKLIEQGATSGTMPAIWKLSTWKEAWSAGSCFYGMLIGAFLGLLLLAKLRHLPLGKLTGLMTYFVASGCVLGRIGCLCAGCCYGKIMPGGWQFPSQLVEASYCALILLFFLIARLERRNPDAMFPLFVLLYSMGRAVLEFFRAGTTRVGVISMSQWVAFALVIVSVLWLIKLAKKKKRGDAF